MKSPSRPDRRLDPERPEGIRGRLLRTVRQHALVATAAILLLLLLVFVKIQLKGRFAGLFLLEGRGWQLLEVKDDLYLGEGGRLIAGVDFGPLRYWIYRNCFPDRLSTSLDLEWDSSDGSGYIVSRFPGGGQLVTNFSRFLDDSGEVSHGLFIGGALPDAVAAKRMERLNETGMAYFDGVRWYHIWCNSNEGLVDSRFPNQPRIPSTWMFLGSRVLQDGPRRVVLSSAHRVLFGQVPVRVDRFAYFHAGERFFKLAIRFRNEGKESISLFYLYGDEPWLGDFGSSAGNVGWTRDGLVERAASIDARRNRYAGFFDFGNRLLPGPRNFTFTANFIEWLGSRVPDVAYFGNGPGYDEDEIAAGTPLASNTRYIGLQWGPFLIPPGGQETLYLAVGMAAVDPQTGMPVKPDVPIRSRFD